MLTSYKPNQFLPEDLAIATRRQINSADDSIVEAEAPTKTKKIIYNDSRSQNKWIKT